MDGLEPLKITVNMDRQCCFASIIVNTVNVWRKSMIRKGRNIDDDRQSLSSINVPPFIRGDVLTVDRRKELTCTRTLTADVC